LWICNRVYQKASVRCKVYDGVSTSKSILSLKRYSEFEKFRDSTVLIWMRLERGSLWIAEDTARGAIDDL